MYLRIDIKKILSLAFIFLILLPGCSLIRNENAKNIKLSEQKKRTGSVAGVADFTPGDFYKFKIRIEQRPKSPSTFETDSLGRFYISGLEPGVYDLRAVGNQYPKKYLKSYDVNDIRVTPGSTSVVRLSVWLSQIGGATSYRQWEGDIIEIDSQTFVNQYPRSKLLRMQESRGKGNMAGYVFDLNSSQPLKLASVWVNFIGQTYATTTDSLGRFFIEHLTSVLYTVCARRVDYHRLCLDGVRIADDSTSIVEFGMWPEAIPEEPLPVGWEEFIIKCDSACFFEKDRLK